MSTKLESYIKEIKNFQKIKKIQNQEVLRISKNQKSSEVKLKF